MLRKGNTETLGQAVKRRRERAGITQSQLARRIDRVVVTVGNIEQGRTKDPGFRVMEAIATELGVSLDEFRGTAG